MRKKKLWVSFILYCFYILAWLYVLDPILLSALAPLKFLFVALFAAFNMLLMIPVFFKEVR